MGGDLGPGWTAQLKLRTAGQRAGSYDTYFYAPDGSVYRSKVHAGPPAHISYPLTAYHHQLSICAEGQSTAGKSYHIDSSDKSLLFRIRKKIYGHHARNEAVI